MSENDKTRAGITATIEDITRLKREMGADYVSEPGDREAYDIVARIERRLMAKIDQPERA